MRSTPARGASMWSPRAAGGGASRVTDDGCGMTRADLVLAVERHATSKLPDGRSARDPHARLSRRGVALDRGGGAACDHDPRRPDEPHAWSLAVAAGAKSEVRPAALAQGTRVEVRDLFPATPARLKFLKTDRTEAEAIRDVVRRLAMSRPGRGLHARGRGARAGELSLRRCRERGRLARLGDVLGADFAANAIEVRARARGAFHRGFAGLPTCSRANALGQFLFVNGRPVRDKLMVGAVRARLCRLSAARPPSRRRAVSCDRPARGRRQRSSRQGRGALPRCRASCARPSCARCVEALARGAGRAASTGGTATVAALRGRGRCATAAVGIGGARRRGPLSPRLRRSRRGARAGTSRGFAEPRRRRSMSARLGATCALSRPRRRPRRSTGRSARRARSCTRPISSRRPATAWSSSTSTPPMSASSMSA